MDLEQSFKNEDILVMPTDTIYGLLGLALNQRVVERIYEVKERTPDKPFIILINKLDDIALFGIKLNSYQENFLNKIWPAKISVVLKGVGEKFHYLSRGGDTLAFRMPPKQDLLDLIGKVGPLVAPSANTSNHPPAKSIQRALSYFDGKIDGYIDGGFIDDKPSTLIELGENNFKVLRQGSVDISEFWG